MATSFNIAKVLSAGVTFTVKNDPSQGGFILLVLTANGVDTTIPVTKAEAIAMRNDLNSAVQAAIDG